MVYIKVVNYLLRNKKNYLAWAKQERKKYQGPKSYFTKRFV